MARKADGSGKIRADLDGAVLFLVDVEEAIPFVYLRIEQAVRRAGMDDLLVPALQDLDRVVRSVCKAKDQVNAAAAKLMEK